MPFPISASGNVDVRLINCSEELLFKNVMAWLEREKARDVQRDENAIRFCAPSFFDGNFWYPIPFVDGAIEITSTASELPTLHYKIRFSKTLIASSLMVFGFFGPLFYFNHSISIDEKISTLTVLWSWAVGGNYLFSSLRFPTLIKIAASGRERKWHE